MISNIQNSSAIQNSYQAASTPPRPPAQSAASNGQGMPQDTVQISARTQALAKTSGDVNHDGDSR